MPVTVPVQFFGSDVQLTWTVNGVQHAPESVSTHYDASTLLKLTGPWRAGRNTIEVIGSGEPVQPSEKDPRKLLYAIQQMRWSQ